MKNICRLFIVIILFTSCTASSTLSADGTKSIAKQVEALNPKALIADSTIIPGAERMQVYLPYLKGKSVAVFANPTSMVKNTHLVDTLVKSGIRVVKIFGPEHGFRGDADAGEHVEDAKDKKTGIPIISIYGDH